MKSAKSGKKSETLNFFLLKMVSNALGTPRNTFMDRILLFVVFRDIT